MWVGTTSGLQDIFKSWYHSSTMSGMGIHLRLTDLVPNAFVIWPSSKLKCFESIFIPQTILCNLLRNTICFQFLKETAAYIIDILDIEIFSSYKLTYLSYRYCLYLLIQLGLIHPKLTLD